MTKLNVSDVAKQFAQAFQRDHRTIYTHDGERVDLEELAFNFQQCIDEFVTTNSNGTNVPSCPQCKEKLDAIWLEVLYDPARNTYNTSLV